MKKLKTGSGMTLLEILVSLLILTLLVTAMGTGMNSAMRVYREARFESESAALAGIINTTLGDVLRYAEDIKAHSKGFIFTNVEYGARDVSLCVIDGILCLDDRSSQAALVNTGAYPDLEISLLQAVYIAPGAAETITLKDGTTINTKRGGFFYITYQIASTTDSTQIREVETVVRLLNTQ